MTFTDGLMLALFLGGLAYLAYHKKDEIKRRLERILGKYDTPLRTSRLAASREAPDASGGHVSTPTTKPDANPPVQASTIDYLSYVGTPYEIMWRVAGKGGLPKDWDWGDWAKAHNKPDPRIAGMPDVVDDGFEDSWDFGGKENYGRAKGVQGPKVRRFHAKVDQVSVIIISERSSQPTVRFWFEGETKPETAGPLTHVTVPFNGEVVFFVEVVDNGSVGVQINNP